MAVSGYQVGAVYELGSYTGIVALGRPVLWMAGASLGSPTGSNLPAPATVGGYGAFNGGLYGGGGTKKESKQLPMRIGPVWAFVSFATLSGVGGGSLRPAYGN